jgi:hypothetical protein
MLLAIVTRASLFGNPVAHIDDQFYLFAGRAMLEGALPYVDFWDRKPIGLFLLYAVVAGFGGDGTIQTQLVAGLFAIATAFTLSRIGRRLAPHPGGLLAGCAYLLLLPIFSGATGQSPIFYNLLVAVAGLLALRAVQRERSFNQVHAYAAMFALGLALAVKPVVAAEGVWIGLVFLYCARQALPLLAAAKIAMVMVLTAATPPTLPYLVYAYLGHLDAVWHATITSNFLKQLPPPHILRLLQLQMGFRLMAPVVASSGSLLLLSRRARPEAIFMAGWVAAAVVGMFLVPNMFDHYALPVLVPLCASLAPLFAYRLAAVAWLASFAVVLWFSAMQTWRFDGFEQASKFNRLVQVISPHIGPDRCLYVFEGPVQLYSATQACRLSPFVFPDHLNAANEKNALPLHPPSEVRRIMEQQPAVVVDSRRVFLSENVESRAVLARYLATRYRAIGTFADYGTYGRQPLTIYVRTDLLETARSGQGSKIVPEGPRFVTKTNPG